MYETFTKLDHFSSMDIANALDNVKYLEQRGASLVTLYLNTLGDSTECTDSTDNIEWV